ncbi:MAG: hypothetical protein ACPGPB_05735 [Flavobacteriaceae bacterium]
MPNPTKLGSNALDGAKVIYGAIKQLKGKNTSNTRGLIGRIIRDIHHDAFPMISKQSELVAKEKGLSFIGQSHHKTYHIARELKICKFHREHVGGGVNSMANILLNQYKKFNSPDDVLQWLDKNYFVVLRLDSEKDKINENSNLEDIKDLIHA